MIQKDEAPNPERDPVGASLDCSAARLNEKSNNKPDLDCKPLEVRP